MNWIFSIVFSLIRVYCLKKIFFAQITYTSEKTTIFFHKHTKNRVKWNQIKVLPSKYFTRRSQKPKCTRMSYTQMKEKQKHNENYKKKSKCKSSLTGRARGKITKTHFPLMLFVFLFCILFNFFFFFFRWAESNYVVFP